MNNKATGEIILYQPDETIRLEVAIENETVWLTQAQMVVLFGRDKSVISRHITNVFKEEELFIDSVVANFATTAADGKVYQVEYYNLDVIISVGYRVKSKQGTRFRQWATKILKEYMLNGIVVNQRIERLEHKMSEFDLLLKISHQQNENLLKNEINQLKQYIEAILSDFNDINEDTRIQIELINQTLAGLQVKYRALDKPRNPIGFKTTKQ